MKVILLKDIKGVGNRFDEKEVSDGYATNFLIPKKLAVPLSPASASAIKQLKEQSESKKALEEKRLNEKSTKRMEKSLELEKFRQEQRSSPSS
jgi:large subunit ribosomal protein L9